MHFVLVILQGAPFVICRLKKKIDEKVDTPDGDRGEPSGEIISDLETSGPNAEIQQVSTIIDSSLRFEYRVIGM